LEEGLSTVSFDGVGSTTLAGARFTQNALRCINIGDGMVYVLRKSEDNNQWGILHKVQDIYSRATFNTTQQVGERVAGAVFHSPVSVVDVTLPVQREDLVLLVTDGVVDNLEDARLLQIVNAVHQDVTLAPFVSEVMMAHLALSIAVEAQRQSLVVDVNVPTPFERHAIEHGFFHPPDTGKTDDISVAVGVVICSSESE
jgi:serine/threonine protein phosphatase PrpC